MPLALRAPGSQQTLVSQPLPLSAKGRHSPARHVHTVRLPLHAVEASPPTPSWVGMLPRARTEVSERTLVLAHEHDRQNLKKLNTNTI